MSARTALMNLARRAAKAPVQVSRRHMSGGGTIEEEIGARERRTRDSRPRDRATARERDAGKGRDEGCATEECERDD